MYSLHWNFRHWLRTSSNRGLNLNGLIEGCSAADYFFGLL